MSDRKPRNRLRDMEVVEISTVPAGDNPDALVSFWKAADGKCPKCGASTGKSSKCQKCEEVAKSRNPNEDPTGRVIEGMPKDTQPRTGDDSDLGEDDVLGAVLEQNDYLAKMLGVVVGVDPASDPEGFVRAFESITKGVDQDDDEDYEDYEDDEYEDEDGDEEVGKSDDFDDDDEDYEDEEDDDDVAALAKADPRFAALIESYEAEITKSQALARRAAEVALGEREARMDVRFAKAAEALTDLGEDDEDLAEMLKALHETCDPELYAAVESTLAKAATLIRTATDASGAFEESAPGAGRRVQKVAAATGPSIEELEALLASGAINKDAADLTPEQAFLKALEANPDAYDAAEMAKFNGGR